MSKGIAEFVEGAEPGVESESNENFAEVIKRLATSNNFSNHIEFFQEVVSAAIKGLEHEKAQAQQHLEAINQTLGAVQGTFSGKRGRGKASVLKEKKVSKRGRKPAKLAESTLSQSNGDDSHENGKARKGRRANGKLTIPKAVMTVLCKQDAPMGALDIANCIRTDLGYVTASTPEGFKSSVYTSGIMKGMKDGLITKEEDGYALTAKGKKAAEKQLTAN